MQALILAGGNSSRLLPITKNIPKYLLPIGNKTTVDRQIVELNRLGVSPIIIITGHHREKLLDHLSRHHPDTDFVFIHNERYTSTRPAEGLWLARDYFENEDETIYLNADLLADKQIYDKVINSNVGSVTAIQKSSWDKEQVNVVHNDKFLIKDIGKHIEPEESEGEFIGLTKFNKEFLEYMKKCFDNLDDEVRASMFAADAINTTIKKGGNITAIDIAPHSAIEIDTPEDLERARALFKTTR